MQSLWPFFFGLLVGAGLGAIGLVRWWGKAIKNPEVARQMIKTLYKSSHPHWLQVSQTDERKVCPVCGWTEAEGKTSEVDKDAPKTPLAERMTEPNDRAEH